MRRFAAIVLGVVLVAMLSAVSASATTSATRARVAVGAKTPPVYKNCTALNQKYAHGIGKAKARDKTSGTPVITFKRSGSTTWPCPSTSSWTGTRTASRASKGDPRRDAVSLGSVQV